MRLIKEPVDLMGARDEQKKNHCSPHFKALLSKWANASAMMHGSPCPAGNGISGQLASSGGQTKRLASTDLAACSISRRWGEGREIKGM